MSVISSTSIKYNTSFGRVILLQYFRSAEGTVGSR
jgi:hypothetical protein